MKKSMIGQDSIQAFLNDLGCDYGIEFMNLCKAKIDAIKDDEDIKIWQVLEETHKENPTLPKAQPYDMKYFSSVRFNSRD